MTTYDAGMAVPDWPTTYGYNLFLYPWQTWILGPFDLFIEHGHRLLGALVGLLSIAFVGLVAVSRWPRHMKYCAAAMFGLVLAQGLLGGVRVRLDDRVMAMFHACLGIATFAYAAGMAVVTSRWWDDLPRRIPERSHTAADSARILPVAIVTSCLIYVQVVLGAMLPDFASMLGTRIQGIDDARLCEGEAHHHLQDHAFHRAPGFCALVVEGARWLRSQGVARGPSRGAAHVGIELLFDGLLVGDAERDGAYLDALEAPRLDAARAPGVRRVR